MAFEGSKNKGVEGSPPPCSSASNAHSSNLVTLDQVQSASVCCHTDKLTQKLRTLSRVRVTLREIRQSVRFLSSAP